MLDVKKEIEAIRKQYNEDPRQKSFNVLLLGEMGTGKTFLLRTCRLPCHVDSFDPGGTKCLRDEIAAGKIIADTRFESENRMSPSMYQLWKTEFERRKQAGYFNHLGTYCIDSSSTWAEAIMNRILQKAKIPGEAPRWAHDYVPQKVEIQNRLRIMLDLPCDFFLTGHLEQYEDQEDKRIRYRYMTTGKGTIIIPTLFDEIYVMDPKRSSSGVEYRILTKNTGTYTARSRLAKGGALDIYEEANIKKLLKKAGLPAEDKPLI